MNCFIKHTCSKCKKKIKKENVNYKFATSKRSRNQQCTKAINLGTGESYS